MENTENKTRPATTGTFTRIEKDVNDDFSHKCKKSEKFKKTDSQSQRDIIIQELMKIYTEKGDNVFNIINSTPF